MDTTVPMFTESVGDGLFTIGLQDDANSLNGSDGDDITIGGNLDDILFGLAGDDLIEGDGGNDTLNGGLGDDTLFGGEGADTLFGGEGADTFSFSPGADGSEIDTINDFDPSEDVIRLNGIAPDALVEYDSASGLLTVDGAEIAQLAPGLSITADNFEIPDGTTNSPVDPPTTDGGEQIQGTDGDNTFLVSGGGADTFTGAEGSDTYAFKLEDILSTDDIDVITDFNLDEDALVIGGITSADNVDYDRSKGVLSINGNDFLQIDPELPLQDGDFEFL